MFWKHSAALLGAAVLMLGLTPGAKAAEVDCDAVYCFSEQDFKEDFEEEITGICITGLPEKTLGTVSLGNRVLRAGDILTAQQLADVTFTPNRRKEDAVAVMTYLPIFEGHVETASAMTLSIRGKENKAPAASDSAGETYQNLPLEGKLTVKDPEGEGLTFALTRKPRRGEVVIHEDGSFTYTPKKNKVGVDSFTYTAVDPAGNSSREATVTITILKPGDTAQYTDTIGKSCRFAAEWMKNTGIFVGETVNGNPSFHPERPVHRGQFVAMLVNALEIPVEEEATFTGYTDEIPTWLQPYLAAAVRAGLTAGLPLSETFGPEDTVTGAEAAVMLQNALDLGTVELPVMGTDAPDWAETAIQVLSGQGITLTDAPLTRGDAAEVLYQASKLVK